MAHDSSKKYAYQFKGSQFQLDERKYLFVQRLEAAIASVVQGQTTAGGVAEIRDDGKERGFYFVDSDAEYDVLLEFWHKFRTHVVADAVRLQGTAPEANRSMAKN